MSFVYLSTPYSKYYLGLYAAYELACEQLAMFVRAGVPCFSPIVHSHGVSLYGEIDPLKHDLWLKVDQPFMDLASALVVVMADGWRDSVGIAHEIMEFRNADKPIYYVLPGVLPDELREMER